MQRNAKDRAPLVVKALGTAGVRRVLDLGGGSGAYSIAFAKACSRCAMRDPRHSRSACRSPPNMSARLASRRRSAFAPGDMLRDDFGSGYDIIMLNAICHMFSEEQNQEIFRRARQALAPNGRLVVQDFILNPEKTGPQHAALFSLNMLVATDAGASYSESEYTALDEGCGVPEVSPDQSARA